VIGAGKQSFKRRDGWRGGFAKYIEGIRRTKLLMQRAVCHPPGEVRNRVRADRSQRSSSLFSLRSSFGRLFVKQDPLGECLSLVLGFAAAARQGQHPDEEEDRQRPAAPIHGGGSVAWRQRKGSRLGINFVQEQGGLVVVHEAKEDGGGDVLGAQGPRGHGGEEIEDGGLATLRLGGSEVQARRVEERGNCVGVGVPEGDGHGRAGRQNGIVGEAGGDLGQDFRTIHRLWSGFNGWQFDGAGLRFVVNIGSAPGNLGIEGFKADAQARRFGLARAVVLGGGEGGEGVESL